MAWRAEDGSIHSTEEAAIEHNRTGGGIHSMGMMGFKLLFIAITIGPVILAKLTSAIFGLTFHLGFVGRIIQSVIIGTVLGFIFMITTTVIGQDVLGLNLEANFFSKALFVTICLAGFVLFALWYFFKKYSVWKYMHADGIFSNIITITFCIPWFGGIASLIINAIKKGTGLPIFITTLVAGAVFYLIKIIPYIKLARENREEDALSASNKMIGTIITAALVCVLPLFFVVKAQVKIATEASLYKPGTIAVVRYETNLLAEANEDADVIKVLKPGARLTITGGIVFYYDRLGHVPVEHNGVSGWVDSYNIRTTIETAPTSTVAPSSVTPQIETTQVVTPQVETIENENIDTTETTATTNAQTNTATVSGSGLVRPRMQGKQNGVGQDIYLDRIERSGGRISFFLTGAPQGRGGDGNYYPFWGIGLSLLTDLDSGRTWNHIAQDEDDGSNPENTGGFSVSFDGVSGSRFSLAGTGNNQFIVFDEIILQD